ncbi:MAG: uronate dehydrogenase [Actinomycetota bacterium]|nr:uronate dehydrogenase [Actinomycetota bacterium]
MTILITGAAGTIGRRLTADLAARGLALRLLDRRPLDYDPPARAESVTADLRDLTPVAAAAVGAASIVHLAGQTQEGPFPIMVQDNITAAHHVLEAARRAHVPRVVLASSHHVHGMNLPADPTPIAPDSFYAASKIAVEALGSLYAAKCDMSVVIVRIGSYRDRPTLPRHRSLWLSPRDASELLLRAATAPLARRILTVTGTSATPSPWWPAPEWQALGYTPRDHVAPDPDAPTTDRFVGGEFAEYDLPR